MVVLLARRILTLGFAASFVLSCGSTPPSSRAVSASLIVTELDQPGGVGGVASTPWGMLVAGNNSSVAWIETSTDGVAWAPSGEETTRKLPPDSRVAAAASDDGIAIVLLNLNDSQLGRLALLTTQDGNTWSLHMPEIMEVSSRVDPVGIVTTASGFAIVGVTALRGETTVLVFVSDDGVSWHQLSAPELIVKNSYPTSVASVGDTLHILLTPTGTVSEPAGTILVGDESGASWRAVDVESAHVARLNAIAASGNQVSFGGCLGDSPLIGTVWMAELDADGPYATSDLGPRTCVDALTSQDGRFVAAGAENGAGLVWARLQAGEWDPLSLPAGSQQRPQLTIDSIASLDDAVLVGGQARDSIGGSGGGVPIVWVVAM